MPTTKDYLLKKYQKNAIDEYLAKEFNANEHPVYNYLLKNYAFIFILHK